MTATTKWFNNQKGYGFITDSDGKDVFVHHSNIVMDGFRHLNEDDVVNFELRNSNDGREQAVSVIPVLTRKMIEDVFKKDNLHIQTMKDGYSVTKYIVVNELDVIQTNEKGMTLMEVAEYAGFEIHQLSA